MTPRVRLVLASVGAMVGGLACAALLDALGLASFAHARLASISGMSAWGALNGMVWPALLLRRRVRAPSAVIGAAVAGVAAFVVARVPFGWVSLGPISAGVPGDLPLLLLPLVAVLAVFACWQTTWPSPGARD